MSLLWLAAALAVVAVRVECAPYYCSANLDAPLPINATNKVLRHVSIIHRHGARVPYLGGPKPTGKTIPGPAVNWTCNLVSQVANTAGDTAAPRNLVKFYVEQQNVLPGDCMLGQLTLIGQQQHHRLGQAYRAKYVHLLRFMPAVFNSSIVWFRSTDYQRTLASLEANWGGFYPAKMRPTGQERIAVSTRDQDTDYLLGADSVNACRAAGPLLSALNQTAAYQTVQAQLAALQKLTAGAVGTTDLSILRDHSWCRKCTGLPDFNGLTADLFDAIDGNVTAEAFLRRGTPALQRLSIGPFFNNVVRMMRSVEKGEEMPHWAHYSAHDSTLTAVFATLDNAVTLWPGYASHVEFELWQDLSDQRFYVQVSLNGNVLTNLFGASAMMSLDEFEHGLSKILISEDEWRSTCHPPTKKKK
jgi:hypothetical protein